jgi:glycosyltransferase involved in cell wall biosynthesis
MDHLGMALDALRAQTLSIEKWETLLVDNASSPAVDSCAAVAAAPNNLRIVRERQLGLTSARRRAFAEARGSLIVMVDDDNVLAPDYLINVIGIFDDHPRVGALGGKSLAKFESEPQVWTQEFLGLIACRDFGDAAMISNGLRDQNPRRNVYPLCAPIGAGMAIRREAIQLWLKAARSEELTDRCGDDLSSSGDNDIVFTLMQHGWKVGYFPELRLTHLIPARRLDADYLARLNRGIQKSWMQVLTKHDANPWTPIPSWTVPLRKLKAWFAYRAWSGPAAFIRWQGACGHFEGRIL